MSPPTPSGREQRLVFGEAPELYDRARFGYPPAAVDHVLAFAGQGGTGPGRRLRALEVGAGTGKATVAFAARGLDIVALEPDPDMAAVARRNCSGFPTVRIEEVGFEDWPVEPGAFNLVYSAQAWHWVRPDVGYRHAQRALRAGGALALVWNRIRWRQDDPVRAELEDVYRRLAPELHALRPGFPGLAPRRSAHEEASAAEGAEAFFPAVRRSVAWEGTFTAASFVELLRTQSDHRLADPAELEPVLAAVAQVIGARGDRVVVPYETLVVLARPRPA